MNNFITKPFAKMSTLQLSDYGVGNSKIIPFNTITKESIIKAGIIKGQFIRYDPVIPKDASPSEINNLFDGQMDFKK